MVSCDKLKPDLVGNCGKKNGFWSVGVEDEFVRVFELVAGFWHQVVLPDFGETKFSFGFLHVN